MKINKLIHFVFFLSFNMMFSSCEKSDFLSQETEKYININISKPFCEFSDEEQTSFFEARERFGNFVTLENGNYILAKGCNAASLNIALPLFNHFKALLEQTNEELKSIETWEYKKGKLLLVSDKAIFFSPLKTKAIEQGGITKIEVNWYGYDFYISNSDLHKIATGATLVSIFSTLIPEPLVSKLSVVISGLCALAAAELEHYYPDGVILSVTQVIPGVGCIPYDISGQ